MPGRAFLRSRRHPCRDGRDAHQCSPWSRPSGLEPRRAARARVRRPRGSPGGVPVLHGLDVHYQSSQFHLWVVGGIAACAVVVALFAASAAYRTGQHGPVWLALGCLAVGFCMLGHGILTPHVHHRSTRNGWAPSVRRDRDVRASVSLSRAGRATRGRHASSRASPRGLARGIASRCSAGSSGSSTTRPRRSPGATPLPHENTINWVLFVVTATLLLFVARVHWRRYRLGHDPVQFALLFVCAMCLAAMLSDALRCALAGLVVGLPRVPAHRLRRRGLHRDRPCGADAPRRSRALGRVRRRRDDAPRRGLPRSFALARTRGRDQGRVHRRPLGTHRRRRGAARASPRRRRRRAARRRPAARTSTTSARSASPTRS